jgi:hypothetical protein
MGRKPEVQPKVQPDGQFYLINQSHIHLIIGYLEFIRNFDL